MDAWAGNFELVNPREIVVDHRYQRPEKADLIALIAGDPDWRMFGVVQCARRTNGMFYCFDGQQRLRGVLRSDSPPSVVPVIWFPVSSPQQEAELFIAINHNRRGVTALEIFGGQVFAGDEDANLIREIVESCGYTIGSGEPSDARSIKAITSLTYIYRVAGEEGLRRVLVGLRNAWPAEKWATSNAILRVLGDIVAETNGNFSRAKFEAALSKTTPGRVLRKAEELRFDMGGSKNLNVRRAFKALVKL